MTDEVYDDQLARALAPAPVSDERRRWRRAAVIVATALFVAAIPLTAALGLADPESDAVVAVIVTALFAVPALLGAVLAAEQVLVDWLTPEEGRAGRAYFLNPFVALGDSGRTPWLVWWGLVLVLWGVGGALVGGVLGVFVGLLIGAVLTGACILLGLLAAWLVVLPLGLLLGVVLTGRRGAQSMRLALIALLMIAVVALAVPIAWAEPGGGPLAYARAVLGAPDPADMPAGALWTARIALAVLLVTLAPLVASFKALPQQEAAGRFLQNAAGPDRSPGPWT